MLNGCVKSQSHQCEQVDLINILFEPVAKIKADSFLRSCTRNQHYAMQIQLMIICQLGTHCSINYRVIFRHHELCNIHKSRYSDIERCASVSQEL